MSFLRLPVDNNENLTKIYWKTIPALVKLKIEFLQKISVYQKLFRLFVFT